MRGVNALTSDCRAARESASARLDGELSGFELARLQGHLRSCPECAVFFVDVQSIADSMRSADLAVPEHRVVVQRRIGPLRRFRVTAVAAAAAVAVGAFGLASSVSNSPESERLFARASVDANLLMDQRRPSVGGSGQVLVNEVLRQQQSVPSTRTPPRLRRTPGPLVD